MWSVLDCVIFVSCVYAFRISKGYEFWSSFWNSYNKSNNYYNKCYSSWSTHYTTPIANHRHRRHHEIKTEKEIKANHKGILADFTITIDLMSISHTQRIVIFVFNKLNENRTLQNTCDHKQNNSCHFLREFLFDILDIPIVQ